MSRSSRCKEKYDKVSDMSEDHYKYEGTAARTRPFSFNEIMSRRKNKKLSENEKEGDIENMSAGVVNEKVSDCCRPERSNGHNKESSVSVQQHLLEGSFRKKEETVFIEDEYLDKGKDRDIRDSNTKSKAKKKKDLTTEVIEKSKKKIHDRRKSDKRPTNVSENEAAKKHAIDKDRHADESREKSVRESKRKYRNGVDDRNRDRNAAKKHDLGKLHDVETLEKKERKELSKSQNELRRRRSRSREREDRKRRSTSLSPRAHKRGSYHRREHGELSSHSLKDRSGRRHSDIDRTKTMHASSSSHYRRRGGSTSKLGGYSPRKRKTEAAVKTPSPAKRSPEKRSAKWDLAPEGKTTEFSVVIPSNFQLSSKTANSNIHEGVNAVPVASTAVKPISGASAIALSTNTNVSVDSVHLTQATRPMRRLYMENIPASASEKALMECLNKFLISSGVNHIRGTQPCISCIMHKERGQALVEFLTPEDASAALSFDGTSFSGSIIHVRRPKDFVEVATGEPEKSMAVVDAISDTVKDSPHMIFIGGISKALTSKMLMEIASAFGPLKSYQFENVKDPDEPFAFLEYADQSDAFKACAGFNGMKLGGQVITAVQAVPNAMTLESDGNPPFCGIPEHAKALLEKPTQVLRLKNVFDSESISCLSNVEIEEVLEDVRIECARFGAVKSVNVVKYGASPLSTSELCGVDDVTACAQARQNLGCDETTNARESIDHKGLEGDSIDDDKTATEVIKDEPSQPGHFDSDMGVHDLECKSISESKKPLQDESDSNIDKVTDDTETMENKLMAREELSSEEVGEENKLMVKEELSLDKVNTEKVNELNSDEVGKENKMKATKELSLEEVNSKKINELNSEEVGEENELMVKEELSLEEVNTEKVNNLNPEEVGKENKLMVKEELRVEEVKTEKVNANDGTRTGSNSIEKGDCKEHDCNLGRIFEPGCVFVEFRRTEASCLAAHCLHGRLFDHRVVLVEYVPLDVYLARFPNSK